MNNILRSRLLKLYSIKRLRKYILRYFAKKENGYAFSSSIRNIYKRYHNIEIGYGTYGGCFSISNIPPGVSFGNYCSIAGEVKIFRANHPMKSFTMHPLFYNPVFKYVEKDQLERPSLKIGHDVWIGSSTIICPGVRIIGNGAVIGAGSVVTKDVPAYAILVGNPAKVIKYRFNLSTIEKLEKSKWWKLSRNELISSAENLKQLVNE